MKQLLLIFLLSTSLTAFSQERGDNINTTYRPIEALIHPRPIWDNDRNMMRWPPDQPTPDTLRAYILVTLSPNGPAHARTGYVVIEPGKRPAYLDCRKKALKLPQVGWGWEIVGVNEKVR